MSLFKKQAIPVTTNMPKQATPSTPSLSPILQTLVQTEVRRLIGAFDEEMSKISLKLQRTEALLAENIEAQKVLTKQMSSCSRRAGEALSALKKLAPDLAHQIEQTSQDVPTSTPIQKGAAKFVGDGILFELEGEVAQARYDENKFALLSLHNGEGVQQVYASNLQEVLRDLKIVKGDRVKVIKYDNKHVAISRVETSSYVSH